MSTVKEEAVKLRENIDKVYEAGRKSMRDEFWDNELKNGTRTHYNYFLYLKSTKNFYPTHDICPLYAGWFAREFGSTIHTDSDTIDLAARLEECGVKMDFSKSSDVTYLFYMANISHLPEINLSSASGSSNSYLFGNPVKTIDKLIITENQNICDAFGYAQNLENVTIEGVITQGINMSWSNKLSVNSMKNIISCLANHKGTDNEFKYKVTFTEARWTALEADSTSPTGTTWREYVQNELGWNT